MDRIKKLVDLFSLKPGYVLAKDIYEYNKNVILYRAGTVLDEKKIENLEKFFGVCSVSVLIPSDLILENEVVERKNVEKFIKENIEHIYNYSEKLVSNLLENKEVKLLLEQIKHPDDKEDVYHHSIKVAVLATVLGSTLNKMEVKTLKKLALAALLHDVGKSKIDVSVLNKPGKLTNDEFNTIKTHSKLGYDILTNVDESRFTKEICEAVLYHHENEDGSGYPYGIKGQDIPLFSKIIHIVDVFSALISPRIYKEAWPIDVALNQLDIESNKFNPVLLKTFKKTIVELYDINILTAASNENRKVEVLNICIDDIVEIDFKAYQVIELLENDKIKVDSSGQVHIFPIANVTKIILSKTKKKKIFFNKVC